MLLSMSRTTFLSVSLCAAVLVPAVSHAQQGQALALDVVGPAANPGKQQRCQRTVEQAGYQVNPGAAVRITLTLAQGFNRLQITSARRGEVLNAPRPPWGMEQLCRDAVQAAAQALAHDGEPPIAYAPAPPGYPAQYPSQQYPQGDYPAPPPPPPSSMPSNGAPPPSAASGATIALDVTGPAANPDKRDRCVRKLHNLGVNVDAGAPLHVSLLLLSGSNRLQITSASRGEVLNQARPPWGVDDLCADIVRNVQRIAAEESGGAPPRGGYAPPPPPPSYGAGNSAPPPPSAVTMTLGPIPPGADLQPGAKAAADRAVAAWQIAHFDVALAAFREAANIQNDPQFLFDEAVCEQRLSQYRQGLAHTKSFLDRAPSSPYRPYGDQLVKELKTALGE
jgi:hypothetical protein